MALRFFHEFKSDDGRDLRVEIHGPNTSVSAVPVQLQNEKPIEFSQPQVEFKDYSVQNTHATVNITHDATEIYDSFKDAEVGDFELHFYDYSIDSDEPIYTGVIRPGSSGKTTGFQTVGTRVEADDLSWLEDVDYTYETDDVVSELDMIYEVMPDYFVGSSKNLKVSANIQPYTDGSAEGSCPIDQVGVRRSAFRGKSKLDVLKEICRRNNATLTWGENGDYWFEQVSEKVYASKTVWNAYSFSFNPRNPAVGVSESVDPTIDFNLTEPQVQVTTDDPFPGVVAEYNGDFKTDLIENYSFERWASEYRQYTESVPVGSYDVRPVGWEAFAGMKGEDQNVFHVSWDDKDRPLGTETWENEGGDPTSDEWDRLLTHEGNHFVGGANQGLQFDWTYKGGEHSNGDQAFRFDAHLQRSTDDPHLYLTLDQLALTQDITAPGEQTIGIALSDISGAVEGKLKVLKGSTLQLPWAEIKLLEDLRSGMTELEVEVSLRDWTETELETFGLPIPTDAQYDSIKSQNLFAKSGHQAKFGKWSPWKPSKGTFYQPIYKEDYITKTLHIPANAPNGDRVDGKLVLNIRRPYGEERDATEFNNVYFKQLRLRRWAGKAGSDESSGTVSMAMRAHLPSSPLPTDNDLQLEPQITGEGPNLDSPTCLTDADGKPLMHWGQGYQSEKSNESLLSVRAKDWFSLVADTREIVSTTWDGKAKAGSQGSSKRYFPNQVLNYGPEGRLLPLKVTMDYASGTFRGDFLRLKKANLTPTVDSGKSTSTGETGAGGSEAVPSSLPQVRLGDIATRAIGVGAFGVTSRPINPDTSVSTLDVVSLERDVDLTIGDKIALVTPGGRTERLELTAVPQAGDTQVEVQTFNSGIGFPSGSYLLVAQDQLSGLVATKEGLRAEFTDRGITRLTRGVNLANSYTEPDFYTVEVEPLETNMDEGYGLKIQEDDGTLKSVTLANSASKGDTTLDLYFSNGLDASAGNGIEINAAEAMGLITANANEISLKVSEEDYSGETIASLLELDKDSITLASELIDIQGAMSIAGDLSSSNYSASESGWMIDYETGNAEFNDIEIRGALIRDAEIESRALQQKGDITFQKEQDNSPHDLIWEDQARLRGEDNAIQVLSADGLNNGELVVKKLTITGTEGIDQKNTNELLVEDQYIVANAGQTGAPSLNGGIKIERGDSADAFAEFEEGMDRWGSRIGNGAFKPFLQDGDAPTFSGLDVTGKFAVTNAGAETLGMHKIKASTSGKLELHALGTTGGDWNFMEFYDGQGDRQAWFGMDSNGELVLNNEADPNGHVKAAGNFEAQGDIHGTKFRPWSIVPDNNEASDLSENGEIIYDQSDGLWLYYGDPDNAPGGSAGTGRMIDTKNAPYLSPTFDGLTSSHTVQINAAPQVSTDGTGGFLRIGTGLALDPNQIEFFGSGFINAYGSKDLYINRNGGNVGIHTDNPSYGLDVHTDIRTTGTLYTNEIFGQSGSVTVRKSFIADTAGGTDPFWITRYGDVSEGLRAYATDRTLNFEYLEDESPGTMRFGIYGTNHDTGEEYGGTVFQLTDSETSSLQDVGILGGNRTINFRGGWAKVEANDGRLYLNYDNDNQDVQIGNRSGIGETRLKQSITFYDDLFENGYAPGWTGSGIGYDASDTQLEVDNLSVRGRARFYELLIEQLRYHRGSHVFGPAGGKVAEIIERSYGGDGDNHRIRMEEENHGIQEGDYLVAQEADSLLDSGETVFSILFVQAILADGTLNVDQQSGPDGSGTMQPEVGYEYAVIGSQNADRKGLMYMTATDSGAPYFDVLDDIRAPQIDFFGSTSDTRNTAADKLKVRLGKIAGMNRGGDVAAALGSEYGLVTGAALLSGSVIVGDLAAEHVRTTGTGIEFVSPSGVQAQLSGSEWTLGNTGSGSYTYITDTRQDLFSDGALRQRADASGLTLYAQDAGNTKTSIGANGFTILSRGDQAFQVRPDDNFLYEVQIGKTGYNHSQYDIEGVRWYSSTDETSPVMQISRSFAGSGEGYNGGNYNPFMALGFTDERHVRVQPNGVYLKDDDDILAELTASTFGVGLSDGADGQLKYTTTAGLEVQGNVRVTNPDDFTFEYDFTQAGGAFSNDRFTFAGTGGYGSVSSNGLRIDKGGASGGWDAQLLGNAAFDRSSEPTIEWDVLIDESLSSGTGAPRVMFGFKDADASGNSFGTMSAALYLHGFGNNIAFYEDGSNLSSRTVEYNGSVLRIRVSAMAEGGHRYDVFKDGDYSNPIATFASTGSAGSTAQRLVPAVSYHYDDSDFHIQRVAVNKGLGIYGRLSANHITTGTLASTDGTSVFDLDDGTFSYAGGDLTYSDGTLRVGGWYIDGNGDLATDNDSVRLTDSGDFIIGAPGSPQLLLSNSRTWRITVGTNWGNGNFRVHENGTLYAEGAYISGDIDATSGSLENLDITGTIDLQSAGSLLQSDLAFDGTDYVMHLSGNMGQFSSHSNRPGLRFYERADKTMVTMGDLYRLDGFGLAVHSDYGNYVTPFKAYIRDSDNMFVGEIAGVNFDDQKLWTSNWTLNKDGSGNLAGGSITWTSTGDLAIKEGLIADAGAKADAVSWLDLSDGTFDFGSGALELNDSGQLTIGGGMIVEGSGANVNIYDDSGNKQAALIQSALQFYDNNGDLGLQLNQYGATALDTFGGGIATKGGDLTLGTASGAKGTIVNPNYTTESIDRSGGNSEMVLIPVDIEGKRYYIRADSEDTETSGGDDTGGGGGSTDNVSVSVTYPAGPYSMGDTVVFSASGSPSGGTYQWSDGSTGSTNSKSYFRSGTYTMSCTYTEGGSSDTDSATVTIEGGTTFK